MSDWQTRLTLLQRAKDPNDETAWEDFVNYYKAFIGVVLYQLKLNENDHDDLTQEILLRIWKVLPEYDLDRARFRTWMSHIIRNKVIDHYRKIKRLNDKQDMIIEESGRLTPVVSEPEIEAIVQKEWEVHVVKLALERINKHFSDRAIQAFSLSMDNYSSQDIADKLGIKANSVIKLKNRVKQRLIQEIDLLKMELEPTS